MTVASVAFAWLAWYWAIVALTYRWPAATVTATVPRREPTIAEYVWGTQP